MKTVDFSRNSLFDKTLKSLDNSYTALLVLSLSVQEKNPSVKS